MVGQTRKEPGQRYTLDEALEIAEREGTFYGWVPAALRAMENSRVDGDWLSPSQADNCARQRVLKATHDYYLDPDKQYLPFLGTAVHLLLAESEKDVDYVLTEQHLSAVVNVMVDGEVLPVTVAGTADRIDTKHKRLTDYKGVASFRYYDKKLGRQVNREMPSPSHEVQANIYKWLAEQNGYEIDTVDIWYIRLERSGTRRLVEVEIWAPEDAGLMVADYAQTIARQSEGELPPAEFLNPDHDKHWLCNLCPVREACEEKLGGGM